MSYPSPASDPNSAKKPQPLPWTHQETLNLIKAYQEKWYSLKRGQLKANQWEEVAVTVAARCGLYDDSSAKTALQCRHKMEKLRRRYRSERQGLASVTPWPYYHAMEALEHGPSPISARPLTSFVPTRVRKFYPKIGHEVGSNYYNDDEDKDEAEEEEEEEDDDEDDDEETQFSKSRSINYILRRPSVVNRFSGLLRGARKRVRPEEEEGDQGAVEAEAAETAVEVEEETSRVELAVEIRRFAERVMRMERKRMEMMQETERFRMEMENRRIEMILNSQRKIVDVISASLGPK